MSVGLAMTRVLLDRHRAGLIVVGSYVALSMATVLAFGSAHLPDFGAFLIFAGLAVCGFYLTTVFVHSDSDVAIPGSTYPSHYFTLPVKTRDLVLWPVFAGILVLGGTTCLLTLAIRYAGYGINPIDATLFIVALLTVLQAIFWSPLGIPYSKMILTIAALVGLISLSFSSSLPGVSPAMKDGFFVAVVALAIAITGRGVARARMGDAWISVPTAETETETRNRPLKKRPPFETAADAQFWYEWRQQGKALPTMGFVFFFVFLIPYAFNDTLSPVPALGRPDSDIVPTVPTFLVAYYPMLIGLMALYGWAIGCGAKRTDLKRGDRTFHLFFGTRPMTDESLVWTKMKVAAASTALAWGLLLLACVPILFVNGGFYRQGESVGEMAPLYRVLAPYLTVGVVLRALAIVAIAAFMTWRNYVIGFWAELSGSLALRYAQPLVAAAIYIVLASSNSLFRGEHLDWAIGGLVLLLAAKIVAAIGVATKQIQSGLVQRASMARAVVGYLGAVVFFEAAVLSLPEPIFAMSDFGGKAGMVKTIYVLLVPLAVPIVRILLAVTMLSNNRHR